MVVENEGGVHSKENYITYKGKSVADRYGEHVKVNDSGAVANNDVIDVNKRGKVSDITKAGKLNLTEPSMTE